jgi:tripartite motif-containing protein 71
MSISPRHPWIAAILTMSAPLLGLALLNFTVTADGDTQPIVFVKAWGQQGTRPGDFHFPIGIAINAADEVFITDHLNNRIQKFDNNGKLLGHFAVLPNPGGIALDRSGNLYLTHILASGKSKDRTADHVSVYRPDGRLLRQWGESGSGPGQFNCPGGIAVARDGRVYVADQTNHRIQVFDSTGKFLLQWGEYGNKPGQFGGKSSRNSRTGGPQFVAFDAAGHLWTTEGANCRIQQFTPAGKPLLAWGRAEDRPGGFGGYFTGFKTITPKSLVGPIALCFDRDDHLWISAVSGRVQQFTKEGKYLRGLVAEQGCKPGQFYAPHGVALDSAGCLYVVDAYNHRIQKFEVAR